METLCMATIESFGPLLNTSSYITADRWHHSIGHGGLLSSSKSQVTLGSRIVNSLKINLTGIQVALNYPIC